MSRPGVVWLAHQPRDLSLACFFTMLSNIDCTTYVHVLHVRQSSFSFVFLPHLLAQRLSRRLVTATSGHIFFFFASPPLLKSVHLATESRSLHGPKKASLRIDCGHIYSIGSLTPVVNDYARHQPQPWTLYFGSFCGRKTSSGTPW
jgi:hypothetical protein